MSMKLITDYLFELSRNNNREWYHANKEQYKAANAEFEALVFELIMRLHKTDDSISVREAKDLTFKLIRDTRFSSDKSPYNPAFRAHIGPGGKLPIPVGYFLMIRPDGHSFLGGGLFTDMFKDATKMMRDYITAHGDEWQAIISAPAFSNHFTVKGTALKKVPQGYDPDHPQAEYLKNKSWYLEYPVSDEILLQPDFIDRAEEIFTAMKPFNTFMNQALKNFTMPSR